MHVHATQYTDENATETRGTSPETLERKILLTCIYTLLMYVCIRVLFLSYSG